MPFRMYLSQASSGTGSLTVTEQSLQIGNFGARITDAGDIFAEFRIDSLNIQTFCVCASTTATVNLGAIHMVGVIGTNPNSYVTPTTVNQLVDMPGFCFASSNDKAGLKIDRRELWKANPLKWFNCSNSTEDFSAGTITFAVLNTITGVVWDQNVIVSGMIQFRSPIDPALIPLDIREKRLRRDLEVINLNREKLDEKKEYIRVNEVDDQKPPSQSSVSVFSLLSSLTSERSNVLKKKEK